MLTLDKIKKEDLERLWNIHKKFYNFPFPDLGSPLYCIQDVIKDANGQIIMAGICKLTSEGIFITNKDVSPFVRTRAIKILIEEFDKILHQLGLEDCHTFAEENKHYVEYLKTFGFKECTGIPLVSFGRLHE